MRRLVIAGGGDRDHWMNYAKGLEIAESIDFKGYVADVRELYGESALFVLPSRREGMSNALLEAQSWGHSGCGFRHPGKSGGCE